MADVKHTANGNQDYSNPNAQSPEDVAAQVAAENNKLGGKDTDGTNPGNDNSKVGEPKENGKPFVATAGKISVNEPGDNVHMQPGKVAPDIHRQVNTGSDKSKDSDSDATGKDDEAS